MALNWFVNSAYNLVSGHPDEINMEEGKGVPQELGKGLEVESNCRERKCKYEFQMPLHYPRYNKAEYESMEEWRVEMLLREYGLNFKGTLEEKRAFAIGAFLWPDQV